MEKYIVIDTANSVFRARHVVRDSDPRKKTGMALNLLLSGIKKCWSELGHGRLVFALEGDSKANWRKTFYEPYKRNRVLRETAKTEAEIEEDELFFQAFRDLLEFLKESSALVLKHKILEADDLIAGWVQAHPEDEHVIVSSDTDFRQLIAENVTQYDPIATNRITLDGFFDEKNKPVLDKKTKAPKILENPEYLLFEKCIRGDASDNIRPAAKGARKKGTKSSVGIMECFADRHNKGFNWNSFMRTRWMDENKQERIVMDDYERNRVLIDLTAQPKNVREKIEETIAEAVATNEKKSNVGFRFLRLCGAWDMEYARNSVKEYGRMFSC